MTDIGGTEPSPAATRATAQAIVDRTCANAWKAISWSAKDTDQTIEEVKANNRARAAYCKQLEVAPASD